MQKTEDTTTGEVICSTCGYLHTNTQPCPNYGRDLSTQRGQLAKVMQQIRGLINTLPKEKRTPVEQLVFHMADCQVKSQERWKRRSPAVVFKEGAD